MYNKILEGDLAELGRNENVRDLIKMEDVARNICEDLIKTIFGLISVY